jgi:hypothetical protein
MLSHCASKKGHDGDFHLDAERFCAFGYFFLIPEYLSFLWLICHSCISVL